MSADLYIGLSLAPDRPVMARYYKPAETAQRSFAPLMVAVDPYSPKLLNARFWGDYLCTWIYDLQSPMQLTRRRNRDGSRPRTATTACS